MSGRPCAHGAAHRSDEPIRVRRLKRIHRRFLHVVERSTTGMFEELGAGHQKDLALGIIELGVDKTDGVPNYGTALERIKDAIINAERKAQGIRSKSWS